jgi:hypothetical protein
MRSTYDGPRPRLPLSRLRRPHRPFFHRIRLAFVPSHAIDLVTFNLVA